MISWLKDQKRGKQKAQGLEKGKTTPQKNLKKGKRKKDKKRISYDRVLEGI